MAENNSNDLFDEDSLTVGDQIALYRELIRIIEKDTDVIRSENSREGWTVWGILGGIVGAGGVLFSQTKDLVAMPAETIKIACSFTALFFLLLGIFNSLTTTQGLVKPGRLIAAKNAYRGRRFLFVVRLLITAGLIYFLFQTDFPSVVILVSSVLFVLPFLSILILYAFQYTERFVGNTLVAKESQKYSSWVFLLCFLIPVVLFFAHLPFPLGRELTSAYVIGIALSSIVFLVEVLAALAAPAIGLAELADLRDDIVFRRLDLNEAHNKYKILREGKSLFDEVKDDYNKIVSHQYYQDELQTQQKDLLEKLRDQAILENDTQVVKAAKQKQGETLSKSFLMHRRELDNSIAIVNQLLPPFYAKLNKAAQASGDFQNQNMILQLLKTKFDALVEQAKQVDSLRSQLTTGEKLQ